MKIVYSGKLASITLANGQTLTNKTGNIYQIDNCLYVRFNGWDGLGYEYPIQEYKPAK